MFLPLQTVDSLFVIKFVNLYQQPGSSTVIYLSIGTPLQFVKIIIFRHPKNWDISKIAKIFSNFLYHMNWDSAFG